MDLSAHSLTPAYPVAAFGVWLDLVALERP